MHCVGAAPGVIEEHSCRKAAKKDYLFSYQDRARVSVDGEEGFVLGLHTENDKDSREEGWRVSF